MLKDKKLQNRIAAKDLTDASSENGSQEKFKKPDKLPHKCSVPDNVIINDYAIIDMSDLASKRDGPLK